MAWGCGSSFGEKPFFRKRTVFPRPPFPKKLTVIYTYFSAALPPKQSLSVFSLKLLPLSAAKHLYNLYLFSTLNCYPLFSSSTAQSYFICLNFKLLPLFSRFDTRLLSAFPLSAQLIYTGSENTWLVYMRMLKSMSCFCIAKKHRKIGAFSMKCGNVLLSHTVSRTVPSALCGLTSVFGMRTGGSHMILSPQWYVIRYSARAP